MTNSNIKLFASLGVLAVTIGLIVGTVVHLGSPSTPAQHPAKPFGAFATPDLPFPCMSFGGVRECAAHSESLVQATTTPFAYQVIQSTSSLQYFTCNLSIASTSATTMTFATSSTPYATTTVLATWQLAANAQGAFYFAPTTTA